MKNIKLFLIDLDGTIYINNKLIKGSLKTINFLQDQGFQICFITNNSSKSKKDYLIKLEELGLNINENQLITSSEVIIDYLKTHNLTKNVYLLGTKSLCEEFVECGIELEDVNVKTVVVGFDKELTYDKLCKACEFISKASNYIITHKDINCPTEAGFIPDVGSFIKLIAESTGRIPDVVGGKPTTMLAEYVVKKFNCDNTEIAFVGDRLYTDIAFANANKFKSILVLTGETKRNQIKDSEYLPDYVLNSIADLKTIIKK